MNYDTDTRGSLTSIRKIDLAATGGTPDGCLKAAARAGSCSCIPCVVLPSRRLTFVVERTY